VFDPVGGALLTEAIRCCRWGAQLLIIGFASGHIPKIAANVALVGGGGLGAAGGAAGAGVCVGA
jgi:NADPH:quinone reductase-like Zn-dependent oxidoreductase